MKGHNRSAAALLASAVIAVMVAATPMPAMADAPADSEWGCGDWGMYGRTLTREFSADCPTTISPSSVGSLVPAWTFRPPPTADLQQATFTASPTIVDGVLYLGGWDGIMYALDADTGSLLWQHTTTPAPGATFGPIVSSAAVADVKIQGVVRRLVIFGSGPRLYALDAVDGAEVWVTYVGAGLPDDPAEIESSPLVWGNTVYVGMDVHDQPGSQTGGVRGGLLALDARTGALEWKYSSEAQAGQPASGCGGVWGSPTLDPSTGLLYFGTANCPAVNDNPALPMEEVTALVAETGVPVWTFRPHQPPGLSSYQDEDEDFGATPNLFTDASGRKVLGIGSKDGSYYALNPATGAVYWNTHVVTPAPNIGGFIGSSAAWDGRVFGGTATGTAPYYHALNGTSGEVLWQGGGAPTYAASAATNDVVFAGALDDVLKAYDADSGQVLWTSPLLGPISSGPAIVDDMVFIGSGTSSSDLCAKGNPGSEQCFFAFDSGLGQQGGIHAFRLALP